MPVKNNDIVLIRQALLDQVSLLVADLQEQDCATAVHDAHKRCKSIRAIIRFLRTVSPVIYRKEDKAFRDLAASLSAMRDADAEIQAFESIISRKHPRRFSSIRETLINAKESSTTVFRTRLAPELKKAKDAKKRFGSMKFPRGRAAGSIKKCLRQTYKQGREAMTHAYRVDKESAFHAWRKKVKALNYQIPLFATGHRPASNVCQSKLKELGEVLGVKHDLMLLRKTLRHKSVSRKNRKAFLDLLTARNSKLTAKAEKLGHQIYSAKPMAFTRGLLSRREQE